MQHLSNKYHINSLLKARITSTVIIPANTTIPPQLTYLNKVTVKRLYSNIFQNSPVLNKIAELL